MQKLGRLRRQRRHAPGIRALPFDHPLYIMYSSGTTGVPKCIVHGAGGTLLQHLKEQVLHTDLKRERSHLLLHHLRLDDVELAGFRAWRSARRWCFRTVRPPTRTAMHCGILPTRRHQHLRHQREMDRRHRKGRRQTAPDARARPAQDHPSTGSPLAPESSITSIENQGARAAGVDIRAAPTSFPASRWAIRCCRSGAASCNAAALA